MNKFFSSFFCFVLCFFFLDKQKMRLLQKTKVVCTCSSNKSNSVMLSRLLECRTEKGMLSTNILHVYKLDLIIILMVKVGN